MKKVANKYYVSWEDIDKFVDNVEIHKSIDFIVALHRGGLALGAMLSHKYNLPLITLHCSSSHKKVPYDIKAVKSAVANAGSILIVDDISDTGKTLIKTVDGITTNSEIDMFDCFILTYAVKVSTTYTPDYYKLVVPDTTWVVFPWEKGGSR